MAITSALLTSGGTTTDAASFTTASVTPGANRLVLVFAFVHSGATAAVVSVSGAGMTWASVPSNASSANSRSTHTFRALSAAPGSGALTISTGTAVSNAFWAVVELDGVDTSGTNGSGAILQNPAGKPTALNVLDVALTTAVGAGNAVVGGVGISVQETPVAGAGYVSLAASNQATNANGFLVEIANPAVQNLKASWTTSGNAFYAAVEVAAAPVQQGAGTASASANATGAGTVVRPFAALTEDWSASDTVKWVYFQAGTVANGKLTLQVNNAYTYGASTADYYTLTGSSVYVALDSPPNVGNGGTEATFVLTLDTASQNTNNLRWSFNNGNVQASYTVASVRTTLFTAAYSATTKFWRIREAGGTVFWDTSPDQQTWTQRASWVPTIAVTRLGVVLNAGYFGTEPSPGTAVWDNLNTLSVYDGAGTAGAAFNATGDGTAPAIQNGAGTASAAFNAAGDGTVQTSASGAGTAGAAFGATGAGIVITSGSGAAGAAFGATGDGFQVIQSDTGIGSFAADAVGDGATFSPTDVVLWTNVAGSFVSDLGDPLEGTLVFTPEIGYRIDTFASRIVSLRPRMVPLVNGSFLTRLVANGAPDGPLWRWRCAILRDETPVRQEFEIIVPIGAMNVDIADCATNGAGVPFQELGVYPDEELFPSDDLYPYES